MRHREVRCFLDQISKEDQVQIERSGRTRPRPCTAARLLHLQQQSKQRSRIIVEGTDDGSVQEQRLTFDTHRLGFVVAGDSNANEAGAKILDGEIEMGTAITKVTAQSDRRRPSDFHARRPQSSVSTEASDRLLEPAIGQYPTLPGICGVTAEQIVAPGGGLLEEALVLEHLSQQNPEHAAVARV